MEKNLQNEEAVKKFKKLAEEIRVCMFITNSSEENHTRPMATIEVEENGTLWFITDIRSIKVEEVTLDKNVHLVYAHPGKDSYMDVWGRSTVITDREMIEKKWTPIVQAWFPQGAKDPNLALLKVEPLKVYYWDAEAGKMISILKIAAAIVKGKVPENGVQGKITI